MPERSGKFLSPCGHSLQPQHISCRLAGLGMPWSVYQHRFARAMAHGLAGARKLFGQPALLKAGALWKQSCSLPRAVSHGWESGAGPSPSKWPSAFSSPFWPPEFKAPSSELCCWPCLSPADPFSPLLTGLANTQGWSLLLGTHNSTTSQKIESLSPIPPVSSSLLACPSLAGLLGC